MENKTNEGMKFDGDKLRYDLVMPFAFEEYVKVLTHGAKKYAANNYMAVDKYYPRYFAAANRHLWQWFKAWITKNEAGKYDADSHVHHLAAVAFNVLALCERDLVGEENWKEHYETLRQLFEE